MTSTLDLSSALALRVANVEGLALMIANELVWDSPDDVTMYTLFGSTIPDGTSAYNGSGPVNYQLQILANSDCQLRGYRVWVPSGGDVTGIDWSFITQSYDGTTFADISGTDINGSGTFETEGWNQIFLDTPVDLSSGTTYMMKYTCEEDSRRYLHAYWATGDGASGITSGPVTAPSRAASLGNRQQSFNGGTTDGEFFSMDIIVS